MWNDRAKRITDLESRASSAESALATERADRRAGQLEILTRMEKIREELAVAIAGLSGNRADRPVKVARTASEFREFAQEGEGVNVQ